LCCSETGGFRFHSNYDNGPAWRRNESRSLSLMSALRVNSGTGTHSAIPPKSGIVYRFSTGEQLADSKHHAILAEFVRGSQRLSASGSKKQTLRFFSIRMAYASRFACTSAWILYPKLQRAYPAMSPKKLYEICRFTEAHGNCNRLHGTIGVNKQAFRLQNQPLLDEYFG
jgi:hypothetical protein